MTYRDGYVAVRQWGLTGWLRDVLARHEWLWAEPRGNPRFHAS
jgi:hypothetical protein